MFTSAFLLSRLTDNLLVLILGAAGLERLVVEFYKTFLVHSTPGKFNPKVGYPNWKEKKKVFIGSYFFALVILVFMLLLKK